MDSPSPPETTPADPGPASPGPVLVTALFLLLAGGAALATRPFLARGEPAAAGAPSEPLPVLGTVPDFRFAERNGGEIGPEDLKGKIWVLDFIFTHCAGICPEMTLNMAGVHNVLRKDPDAVCLSVTVDPERDTPEVLREYADRYGASGDRWLFLRGTGEEVHALAYDGFHIGDPESLFVHSSRFVLVDRAGRIRGYYKGTEREDVSRLLADYRRLRDGTAD